MPLVCSIANLCQHSEQNGCCTQPFLYCMSLLASLSSRKPL